MKKMVVSVVALMVLASGLVLGQPRERMREMAENRMQMRETIMNKLNLTDDQEAKMKRLQLDLERKQSQTRSKIHMAQLDMKELMLADKLDRAAIEKGVKTISELQQQVKLNRIDHLFAVQAILTHEQQKTWRDHLGKVGPKRENCMPMMGGQHRMRNMMMDQRRGEE